MKYCGLLDDFIKILEELNCKLGGCGKKAPRGEKELIEFYDTPNNFKHPQQYWSKYGKFAHISTDAFDHVDFFRKHRGFWVHTKIKGMVQDIFQEIADKGLAHEVTSFDGCYNHRVIRGGSRLSIHSFGAAVDLSAERMPLGSDKRFSEEFIKIWTKRGWTYGGDFKGRKDPMHFEYGGY